MREKRPGYNLISNNCQNFATALLEQVQLGNHREFGTTWEIYQRATGDGEIKDLYSSKDPETQQKMDEDEEEMSKPQRQNTVQTAVQVMDENTTKLDNDHD